MQEPAVDQSPFHIVSLEVPWPILIVAGLTLFMCLVFLIWRRLRRREQAAAPPPADLAIDVSTLPLNGPDNTRLRIEVYGIPVRIAVIVLAPVGRVGSLPPADEFTKLIEQLVPGFSDVVIRDQPVVRPWPGQLSSQGFANAFFNHVPLPGARGKGTPWCSLVGKFTAHGKQFLAGIVCCASRENSLSQLVIQHEGQWNDVLRVRR